MKKVTSINSYIEEKYKIVLRRLSESTDKRICAAIEQVAISNESRARILDLHEKEVIYEIRSR